MTCEAAAQHTAAQLCFNFVCPTHNGAASPMPSANHSSKTPHTAAPLIASPNHQAASSCFRPRLNMRSAGGVWQLHREYQPINARRIVLRAPAVHSQPHSHSQLRNAPHQRIRPCLLMPLAVGSSSAVQQSSVQCAAHCVCSQLLRAATCATAAQRISNVPSAHRRICGSTSDLVIALHAARRVRQHNRAATSVKSAAHHIGACSPFLSCQQRIRPCRHPSCCLPCAAARQSDGPRAKPGALRWRVPIETLTATPTSTPT